MKNLILFGCLMTGISAFAQDTIQLKNPSFEAKEAIPATTPVDWLNLGPAGETPPDIQPGWFAVDLAPQNGKTYLGLIVRENNTWELVGQRLSGFLRKDSVYTLSVYLARSQKFMSPTKTSRENVKFNAPTILKIWGYNTRTEKEELLAESSAVSHSEWVKYTFSLKPTVDNFDELDLSSYYAPGFEKKNGNLLIDNCSPIIKVPK